MNDIRYLRHDSPIGPLLIATSPKGLVALWMSRQRHVPDQPDASWSIARPSDREPWRILSDACEQLDAYFAGERTYFELPLDLDGTAFQRTVWRGLCDIGYGETIGYGELARRIGKPAAMRAVGLANGRNPVSIVVPCHRVIGADGSLTGFGGGIDRKRFLLALEAGARGKQAGQQQLMLA